MLKLMLFNLLYFMRTLRANKATLRKNEFSWGRQKEAAELGFISADQLDLSLQFVSLRLQASWTAEH